MRCASIKTLTEGRNKSGSQLLRQLEAETWCWGKNNHRAFIITDPLGRGVIKYTLPRLTVHYSFLSLLCLFQLHLVSLHKVTTVMKSWPSLIHLLLILSKKVLTVARRSSRSECNSLCALCLTVGGTYVRIDSITPWAVLCPWGRCGAAGVAKNRPLP